MANVDVTVLEADGVTQKTVKTLDVGRQAAAASKSVAMATEDKAVLDAIAASLATLDNSISGSETQVDVVAALPAGTNNIGDVDVLTVVTGTGATNLGKAEDAAHSSGDTGVFMLAVRTDTAAASSGTTGDYEALHTDDLGNLRVHIDDRQLDGSEYETVAASQTTQTMGATGATGDYLREILVVPATTSPGNVQIKDGAGSAITVFTGGASSVSNLVPFTISLGLTSTAGAWQITTGANVSAIGIGNFT